MKCIACDYNEAVRTWYADNYPKEKIKAFCETCISRYSIEKLEEIFKSWTENKGFAFKHGIKHDDLKINFRQVLNKDFLPTIEECSVILEQGSLKYSQDNWKSLDPERLKKALLRHLLAYLSDEIYDEESNQKHLSHVITNCMFLNWFENERNCNS